MDINLMGFDVSAARQKRNHQHKKSRARSATAST